VNAAAQISYLGRTATDGTAHGGGSDRRPSTPVAPVIVDLHVTLPVAVHVGWGDRAEPDRLAVWTDADADGLTMEASADETRAWRRHDASTRYPADAEPTWAEAFRAAVAAIRAAARSAEVERADVRTVCDAYRAILRTMDREPAAHRSQWERDVQAIARRFRRARVVVGEQTVPGLCIVRSTRGTPLGYAHVWGGRWQGRVTRVGKQEVRS
jgi:hypothetical protein